MKHKRKENIEDMIPKLLKGDHRAAARLITMVENGHSECNRLMKLIYSHTGKAMVIGITGAGGSGKSCLLDHLINRFHSKGQRVGIIAVDPSSPFSGGAFLGDRIRFQKHSMDNGIFIRSMGSRGYLGGLARATTDVSRIMEAMGNDVVFIETLGVGQDEVDIIHVAQTCLLVMTPGMGDDIQTMKAGIMEIADIIVLNKSDLEGAESCLRNLETTLHLALHEEEMAWVPKLISTVAIGNRPSDIVGIDSLVDAILEHQTYLRKSQAIKAVQVKRIEQELNLIFKDEVEKLVFSGLKGTGKKSKYIEAIMNGENDPYSVVEEVLRNFLPKTA